MRRFVVETFTFCDGWVNCWRTYDDDHNESPSSFDMAEEALSEAIYYANAMLESNPNYEPETMRVVNVATQEARNINFTLCRLGHNAWFDAQLGKQYKIKS